MITHFFQFTDEASAKAALPDFWVTTENGWSWRQDFVDAPVPVMEPTGQTTTDPDTGAQTPIMQPKPGYFLNAALPALDSALPGLTGAGYRDPVTKSWVVLYGAAPATKPQREFAA